MKKILVTGGTVFVSQYVAEYFAKAGDEVYVLNRNRHTQPESTILIEADRNRLGEVLKQYRFDAVLDINSYTKEDIEKLLDGLGAFQDYIFISSSAVYPDTAAQPFKEEQPVGANQFWPKYGMDKIEAEEELLHRVPHAYVLRPPYLYGPMNDIYREAFVFDCAEEEQRKFYLPKDGNQKLQFFYIEDLCRCISEILTSHPDDHIFNVGNEEALSVKEWVTLCYETVGKEPQFVCVNDPGIRQRDYFCFPDYEYRLDVTKQTEQLLSTTMPMKEGLKHAYAWYQKHRNEVERQGYLTFVDERLHRIP